MKILDRECIVRRVHKEDGESAQREQRLQRECIEGEDIGQRVHTDESAQKGWRECAENAQRVHRACTDSRY